MTRGKFLAMLRFWFLLPFIIWPVILQKTAHILPKVIKKTVNINQIID